MYDIKVKNGAHQKTRIKNEKEEIRAKKYGENGSFDFGSQTKRPARECNGVFDWHSKERKRWKDVASHCIWKVETMDSILIHFNVPSYTIIYEYTEGESAKQVIPFQIQKRNDKYGHKYSGQSDC